MIYEENPTSFDEVIRELTRLKEKINALPWKFEMQFPTTSSIPNVDTSDRNVDTSVANMDTSRSNVDTSEIQLLKQGRNQLNTKHNRMQKDHTSKSDCPSNKLIRR